MKLYLSNEQKILLLSMARQSIEQRLAGKKLTVKMTEIDEELRQPGATFVTLTKRGNLRGCIGTLKAYRPLVQDVCEHALAAAFEDFRFSGVTQQEMAHIEIEISCLSQPERLEYLTSKDLLEKLRPGIDGVTLKDGFRQATFLPQVWEQLPGKEEFLAHLCSKMGAPADAWKKRHLEVETYQVMHFSEADLLTNP